MTSQPVQRPARINLSGTVAEAGARTFRLDHGAGTVVVDVAGADALAEAAALPAGDDGGVHGGVDDRTFDDARIDARAVLAASNPTDVLAAPGEAQAFDGRGRDERRGGDATRRGTFRTIAPDLDGLMLATAEGTVAIDSPGSTTTRSARPATSTSSRAIG